VISQHEMPAHKVEISGQAAHPVIRVDGFELRTVVKASLTLAADEVPVLKVALLPLDAFDIGVQSRVVVDKATEKALKAMGWVPPPVPGEKQ